MLRPSSRVVLSVFAILLVLFSCRKRTDGPYAVVDPDDTAPPIATGDEPGLVVRLSHADPSAADRERPKVAEATPLSEGDTKKVLARLPKPKTDPDDEKDFALREGSLPPPRTGATVLGAFPPAKKKATSKTAKAKGPLEVVRFAPEGDVPIAPHLQVTFSHPMVAVTSLQELAKGDLPVALDPTPPEGKWRWIGTKTLLFEPATRLPMATEYTVTVPKGTKSAIGTSTTKATTWTFTTPAPVVESFYPQGGPTRLQPVMFASFDQRIDPEEVLGTITLKSGRKDRHAVRLAAKGEVEADEIVRRLAAEAEDGRWLAFVPSSPLPSDTEIGVAIGPGTPSAEGPRTTKAAQSYSFSTFGPMKVTEHRCGYDGNCPPGTPFEIVFSNPVDLEKFDAKTMVKVSPELPGLDVQVYGNYLYVYGRGKQRTTYKVDVSGRVPDEFGQRLGKDEKLRFRVTDAEPSLWSAGSGLVVLDPAAASRFSVFSVNHAKLAVRAWKVEPGDWAAYLKALERVNQDSRDFAPPGKQVIDTTVAPKGEDGEIIETAIDLSAGLSGGKGHLVVVVEPTKPPKEPWMQQRVLAWVQATSIGLQAHVDDDQMLVWTTALATGEPMSGTAVELQPGGVKGTTGADGLATLVLPKASARVIVAKKGADVAFLPESVWWWGSDGTWRKLERKPEVRWYVFDDRHLYRPGEEVNVKGWLRSIDPGKGGDVGRLGGSVREVSFVLRDSQGNEIEKGTLALNAFDAFDTKLKLPKTMNLGPATMELSMKSTGVQAWHSFDVQEFRRPEYEVTSSLSEGPHVVGEHAVATVAAKYYAGGALPNAEVDWTVSSSPGFYQPPGHDGFVFGKVEPWWMYWRHWGGGPADPADQPKSVQFSAHTDASGEHHLKMDFVSVSPARAMSVTAQATVMDVNRQAWSTSASTVVHASSIYVGLKSDRAFVQAGEDLEIDAIAVDIDGKVRTGVPIRVKAVRLKWEQKNGEMVETEVDARTCDKKSAADPVRCTMPVKEGGSWRITAVVADEKGRDNRTEMTMWVAGGDLPAPRQIEQETVLLIPDRESYEAGQTAKIAVAAPWAPAEGLVTLRRSGIVKSWTVELEGPSTTIEVPIEEGMTPTVYVQVDLVGAAPRRGEDGKVDPKLPRRPAYAMGSATLSVPPRQRTLALKVEPGAAKIEPGGSTTVDVIVKDHAGATVSNAEVALVVVDEAVLALTGYSLPDPLATFYGWRDAGVRDHHLRQHVMLARAADVEERNAAGAPGADKAAAQAPMGGNARYRAMDEAAPTTAAAEAPAPPPSPEPAMAKKRPKNGADGDDASTPIAMRSDFSALALFSPSVKTGADGRATVPLKLPDNLTRYRIMAVAVAGEKSFGAGESTITARLPLMVRPSPPRFLNFGDELELPVVLQNQTDAEMTVDVAMRTSNLPLTDGAGRRVTVPANDRVEVRFPAKAALAGTARAQIGAASGKWADAASFELPVWTPATTEAFATYGELDEGAVVQPVKAPDGVFAQFGGLEITTSSTAVQALTDAVLYLVSYPFECSEQVASRVLAVAALKDVLAAFQAKGMPEPKELVAAVDRDIEKLARMQADDGGFSFWGRGWPSWPYVTIHVTHALERARLKGFTVPKATLSRAREYLQNIESHLDPKMSIECKRILRAYALYVLKVGGTPLPRKAKALVDEAGIDKLPLEALAWILPTLAEDKGAAATVAKIHRHFGNRVAETAADAHFVTSYDDGAYLLLHSDRRADALILEALVDTDPKSDLVPKLVRGLLDHRKAGAWSSTQENSFVLLALDRYFAEYEKITPDFVARAWLGKSFAGDHKFKGRTTERHHIDVPMKWLVDAGGEDDLVLEKKGKGRMYYRVGMRYAPKDLKLPPYDAGFVVERQYEAVDDPKDVRRDADGTWHIAAGARVRVRIKMVAEARRYHVALVDPLPAGLEAQNPVLATTGALPADPKGDESAKGFWWWFRPWYEHQNMRDERVEAFASLLWDGVHDFDYIARATTPGRFVVPPPKAEEMYHPETFGRGSGDIVIVE
jgi:uncharacterized protein YfaS (alpha-2-macroglobulin family)